MNKRLTTAALLSLAVAAALALRVLPAWSLVFSGGAVNFQEGDAWFHVRTVHNLLAHFPRRSGFDPCALFPGGQNVPTGPLWDFLIATPAWVLGLGAPAPLLIDGVAAWLPAILGALCVVPAFFLARRLFGVSAAWFAALWMAVEPGGFMWYSHLGLADHHAAEGLFALLTLALLCAGIESGRADGLGPTSDRNVPSDNRARMRFSLAAGLALGAFLATRPAGIFIPGILACAAVLEPLIAVPVLIAVVAAAAVFVPVTGDQWSDYAWMSLAATAGVAAASRLFARRRWALAIALAVGAAVVLLARPALVASLAFEIRRLAGAEPSSRVVATVQELEPIYRAGNEPGLPSVVQHLGVVWIPALLMLGWVVWQSLRKRRPALTLLIVWAGVAAIGTLIQARMLTYFLPVAAVLAGAAFGQLAQLPAPKLRAVAWAVLAALIAAVNLPPAIRLMRSTSAPGPGWNQALAWLRQNSPEPFADSGVWSHYYPRRGATEPVAAAADWGVGVWWERGYTVEQIAHRVPMSNGTQSGAEEMARFFTDTLPEAAVDSLRVAGARYVIIDPTIPLFAGQSESRFPVLLQTVGRDLSDYFRLLMAETGGRLRPVPVYLPAYYRTMAARLYLANGAAVPGTGPWIFQITQNNEIASARHFDSEPEADAYLQAHPLDRLVEGCPDAGASCFALPAVKGMRLVYTSDPLPISPQRAVRAVKVFEITAQP
jgi:dolichyl-diphosphooligosaccharide--protein glycosyltransferase